MSWRRGKLFKKLSVVDVALLLLIIDGAFLLVGATKVLPDLFDVSKLNVVGLPTKAIILKVNPARSRWLRSGKTGNISTCQGHFSTTNGQEVYFSLDTREVYFSSGIDCEKEGGTAPVVYDPQDTSHFRFGTRTSILTQLLQSLFVFSLGIIAFIGLLLILRFVPPPPPPTYFRHRSRGRRRGAKREEC